MTQKATTKDELYMLKLFDIANRRGDAQSEVDRFEVGRAIGLQDRAIETITRLLLQANFVKKGDEENTLYLTDHGLRLVHHLQANRK